jgi:hypothetical protein
MTTIPAYLAELLLDTLDQFVDDMPVIYNQESNITLVWEIHPTQDASFEAFRSREDMKFFLEFIIATFEKNWVGYCMKAAAGPGPVLWEREGYPAAHACYIEFQWCKGDHSILGMPPSIY